MMLAACGHPRAVTMMVVPVVASGLAAMPTATDCTDQPGSHCGRDTAIAAGIGLGVGLIIDAFIWRDSRHPQTRPAKELNDRFALPHSPLPPPPPTPAPVPQPLPPEPTPPPKLPGAQ